MTTLSRESDQDGAPPLPTVLLRIALMAGLVLLLVVTSTPLRTIDPLPLRIATNILFFVVLGAADQGFLAPVLNRWPLARAAMLIVETLALGWFFSPGRLAPAPRWLFYTHLVPFFVAVLAGALVVALVQWRRRA